MSSTEPKEPRTHKIVMNGYEIEELIVKPHSPKKETAPSTGYIYLKKSWIGHRVAVVRLD